MTFSSQVILSIFFLYIVIISEQLFSIISCRLQKLVKNNILFKHVFIFANILLFTFILGWYTEKSIYSNKKHYIKENYNNKILNKNDFSFLNLYKNEIELLLRFLSYSVIIYIIFLLTTKCKLKYLCIFLLLIMILLVLFIIRTYSKNDEDYMIKNDFSLFDFISVKEKNKQLEDFKNILESSDYSSNEKQIKLVKFKKNLELQNIEFVLFIISLIILVIGFITYGIDQYKDYKNEWSTIKFIFGTNTCKSIKV